MNTQKKQTIISLIAMGIALSLLTITAVGFYQHQKSINAEIAILEEEIQRVGILDNNISSEQDIAETDTNTSNANQQSEQTPNGDSFNGIWQASNDFKGKKSNYVLIFDEGTITYYEGNDEESNWFAGTYAAQAGWDDRFDITFTEGSKAHGYSNPYKDALLNQPIKVVIEAKKASGEEILTVIWIDGQVETLFQTRYQEQTYEYASKDPGRW